MVHLGKKNFNDYSLRFNSLLFPHHLMSIVCYAQSLNGMSPISPRLRAHNIFNQEVIKYAEDITSHGQVNVRTVDWHYAALE